MLDKLKQRVRRKPRNQMAAFVAGMVMSDQDGFYAPIYALELYNRFIVSGADYKGQISTGIVQAGIKGSVSVSFSIIPLPDCLSFANLSAEAELSMTASSAQFLIIQVQPKYIIVNNQDSHITNIDKPICFLSMTGHYFNVRAQIKATAMAGVPTAVNKIGPEEYNMGLKADLTASASAGVEGEYMHVYASNPPQYFRTGMDKTLVSQFKSAMGALNKSDVRVWAYNWINDIAPKIAADIPAQRHKIGFSKYSKTQDLKDALQRITGNQQYASHHDDAKQYIALLDEAKTGDVEAAHSSTQYWKLDNPRLCFISVWGCKGDVGAGISLTAGANLNYGDSSQGAELTLATNADGALKLTNYRFQTVSYSHGLTNNIIATQDTVINYRQASFEAKAQAVANLPKLNASAQASAKLQHNMITYRSAIGYWLYARGTSTKFFKGSGLCFGVSVLTARLIRLAQEAKANNITQKRAKLLSTLAQALRVNEDQLKQFARNSLFAAPDITTDHFPTDSVLLESGFALPEDFSVGVRRRTVSGDDSSDVKELDKKFLTNVTNKFKTSQPSFILNSIRGRYRIADTLENEKTLFKLGLKFGPGLGIQLNSVQKVGLEGVVDLHTEWFAPDLAHDSQSGNSREAYERAVPPVALLHQ